MLEMVAVAHVAALVIFGAWALGGNTAWAQLALSMWGSLSLLISFAALRHARGFGSEILRTLRWLWPLGLFNAVIIASSLNASFREVLDGANTLYVEDHGRLFLPSTARPLLSLQALWFFDATYLSCFNLALVVRSRRTLRALLLGVLANATLLAVFGTVQKLAGADALFFGLIKSPQIHFFSTFIYHNHWGAFTVLMTAVALGLVFNFARRSNGSAHDFWNSPAPAILVAIALLALSIPLSTSRSCTVLVGLLLFAALLHALILFVRHRRASHQSLAFPLAGGLLAIAVSGAFAYNLAKPAIETRIAATRDQLAELRARGNLGSRAILYQDTWNMAREKIWFGWGMASYPTAFFHRNTQEHSSKDGLPMYFHDAHSDWLQSISEVGFVGTALLGLCALVPLYHRRRSLGANLLVRYLLAGCGMLVLYAAIEFPFGNRAVVAAFWMTFFCAVQYSRLDASSERRA